MKKKIICLILAFTLLSHSSIFADPKEVPAASSSTQAATQNRWQTWGFVAGTLIVATVAIILVHMNKGSPAKNDTNSFSH